MGMSDNRYLTGTPKLPGSMNREIGAIITRWAYLEQHLQRTWYLLLGVTMEQGRLAVQQPKAHEQAGRIRDLAQLRTIQVDEKLLKSMTDRIKEIADYRNSLAHGVWFYSPNHRVYALSFVYGTWSTKQDAPAVMRKKKIAPEGLLLDAPALREICDQIDQLINDAKAIHEQILALGTVVCGSRSERGTARLRCCDEDFIAARAIAIAL
jgi:hypothetical protein